MIRIINNADAFASRLQARANTLTERLMAAVNDLSVKLQVRILERPGSPASNAHRRKGWLANSIRPIPAVATPTTVVGGVQGAGGDAWYGSLFEEGSPRAYPIFAVSKKALMFEMHGEQVFLRKVMHPGFDSYRLAWGRPVLAEMKPEIKAEIQAATIAALRG